MTRRPISASTSYRNGLKWRDGRPRWEPSPASREVGLSGLDLKTLQGDWMTLGAAIDAAQARHLWAKQIRDASQAGVVGADAREELRQVLDALPDPTNDEERLARRVVDDLVAAGRRLLGRPELQLIDGAPKDPRTVRAMIEAFFADPVVQAGPFSLSIATLKNYRSYSKRIIAEMGDEPVAGVTRGYLRALYVDLYEETSPATAYGTMGALSGFFKWAMHNDWVKDSPATKLGRVTPAGRRVFWTAEEEIAFIPWCDANGFEDVADAITLGLWTAARSWDMCDATISDLAGDDWRYIPHKTAKSQREALPGILPPVRARVERRRRAAAGDKVRPMTSTPFLYDFRLDRPHTSSTIAYRFREAKFLALLRDAVPETLSGKRIQDTRDTCITRLYEAGVEIDKIPAWTGHSPDDRDDILREHYIVLRSQGAAESAAKLAAWASKNGLNFS